MEKLIKLFEPGKIGKLEIKNRIALGPLGYGFHFGTKPDGYLTDRLLGFYEARARGGAGLIQLTVASLDRPYATQLVFGSGVLSIRTEQHLDSARRFTSAIHAYGTKLSFSVTHIGAVMASMVQRRPPVEYPELLRVVAPTGTRDPFTGFETHTLSKEEIQAIVEAFGQAAVRGKVAGFDAVRIGAMHGYLLHEFLSPRTNQRTDDYGGSNENRARFACEIIKHTRKEVGPDFPIIIRMNGDDFLSGGITVADAAEHARLFVRAGADALDVSSGPFETHHWQYPLMYQPYACLAPLAAAVKKAAGVPVIAVGKIDAVLGERILREGSADFIEMARALIADPDLPNKAREGKLDEIRPCIYCGWCQSGGTSGSYANCTVNVAVGKELEYKIEAAPRRKKVMVIGGGPAGMEAARTLAERGHDTSLYEKTDTLGGQWRMVANHIPEEAGIIKYLSAGLKNAGVKVFLKQDVTPKMVRETRPDAVVLATGSLPATLDIPGINGKNVVQATDVLLGKAVVGQEVVVVGGRMVGLDVALSLAAKDKHVSIVTRSKSGRGVHHNNKQAILEYLIKYGVHIYEYSVPDSVTEEGVNCWWDSGEPQNRDNIFFFLKADTVVLAVGATSNTGIGEEISGFISEFHAIGDCAGKRSIFAAIRDGSEVGHKI
jgi:2,4-dienoyl-CoA reductase-like NADH-dependent reductase (Old Yellow Enzyme family)/thioredoxin reductase